MKRILCALALALCAAALSAQTETKIALVVGNAAYKDIPSLKNSVNDAKDMSAALKRLGWRVIEAFDADRRSMLKSVGSFKDALRGSPDATALFYYAGHGVQLDSKNYLLPINELFEGPEDVKYSALSLDEVINAYSEGKALKCVTILDACRENPFDKAKTRNIGTTRGLSVIPAVEVQGGSATIFATAAGDVAQDGTGRNGIFTAALLKQIETGQSLNEIFTNVSKEVKLVTSGKQNPFINSSGLIADIYIGAKKAPVVTTAASDQGAAVAAVGDKGKARFESAIEGTVYMGSELLGDVGPDAPLVADALPVGRHDFRLLPFDNSEALVKTANVSTRAATTVVFNRSAVATSATTTSTSTASSSSSASNTASFMDGSDQGSKDPKAGAGVMATEVALLIQEREKYQMQIKSKQAKGIAPLIINIASWTTAVVGLGISISSANKGDALIKEYNSIGADNPLRIMELNGEIDDVNQAYKAGWLVMSAGLTSGITTLFFLPNTAKEKKAVRQINLKIYGLSQ